MSDEKPTVGITLTVDMLRQAKEIMDNAEPADYAAFAYCVECEIRCVHTHGPVRCPTCSRNYFWVGEELEKYSGPKYIKD